MHGHSVILCGIVVAQDEGLVHTDGGAGGGRGGTDGAVLGHNIHLYHRAALAVDDLAGVDALYAAALELLRGKLGNVHYIKVAQVRAGVAGEHSVAYLVESLEAGVAAQGLENVDALFAGAVVAGGIGHTAGDDGGAVRTLGVNGQAHAAGSLLCGDGVRERELLSGAAVTGYDGVVEDFRCRFARAQQHAGRLYRVAVVLYLACEGGKHRAHVSRLALKEGGENDGGDAHVLGDALRRQAGVGQAVDEEVGVLGERLGGLALGTYVHYIINNALGQTVGDVVIADDLTRLLEGGLIRSHRGALVVLVRLADIAGSRSADRVGDAEADELRAALTDALCEHTAVHGGNVAANGVYLVNTRAGLEHNVGRVDFVLERDALDGAAHKSGGAAAYDDDEQIVLVCAVNELYYLLARTQTLFIGERVSADENVGAAEHVSVFLYFNYRNTAGQILSEYLIYSHGHMVARLTCAEKIHIALLAQVPSARADAQHAALHVGNALYALVSIEMLKSLLGDIKHDLSAFDVTVRKQYLTVFDLFLHMSFLQQVM